MSGRCDKDKLKKSSEKHPHWNKYPQTKKVEYIREYCDALSDYTENVGDYELLNNLILGPNEELYKTYKKYR